MTSEKTTSRSPARVGPVGIEGLADGGAVSAEGDERGAEGGDGEGEPADPVHALVGEESCADGKNDRMVPTISEAWETVVRRGRRTG